MRLYDSLMTGTFKAYSVDLETKEKKLVYEDHNQIQSEGAVLLANALIDPTAPTPQLYNIQSDSLTDTAPANNVTKFLSPPFTYTTASTAFQAYVGTVPEYPSQPNIICIGTFAGETLPSTLSYGYHYNFALILDLKANGTEHTVTNGISDGAALAYKYVTGGVFWGTGIALEVVWTIHLGSA